MNPANGESMGSAFGMSPIIMEAHLKKLDPYISLISKKARLTLDDVSRHAIERALVEIIFAERSKALETAKARGIEAAQAIVDLEHEHDSKHARVSLMTALDKRDGASDPHRLP